MLCVVVIAPPLTSSVKVRQSRPYCTDAIAGSSVVNSITADRGATSTAATFDTIGAEQSIVAVATFMPEPPCPSSASKYSTYTVSPGDTASVPAAPVVENTISPANRAAPAASSSSVSVTPDGSVSDDTTTSANSMAPSLVFKPQSVTEMLAMPSQANV